MLQVEQLQLAAVPQIRQATKLVALQLPEEGNFSEMHDMDYSANPQLSERGKVRAHELGQLFSFRTVLWRNKFGATLALLHSRHAPMRAILGRVANDGEGKLLMPAIHLRSAPSHNGFGKCFRRIQSRFPLRAKEYNSRLLGDSQALEFGGELAEGARDGLDVGPVEAQQLQRRRPVQARHLSHAARLRNYPGML